MASVSEIKPLSSEFDMPANTGAGDNAIQQEIAKLGKVIADKATIGLKTASQTVVQNVPDMIKQLTTEIETGSIKSFGNAINKLNDLIDKLGINLRDYNSKLADTVDKFRGKQEKLQDYLAKLREEGIKAEINQRGTGIKFLTEKQITQREKEFKQREKDIEKLIDRRKELRHTIEENKASTKESISARGELKTNIKQEAKLREKQNKEGEVLRKDTTADTGGMGNFSKLSELKEAFMVIPDTITESFMMIKGVASKMFKGVMALINNPLKTIGRLFKSIANVFRTARMMIALKVIAVIAAIQFFAERIEAIGDVFVSVWDKITGFFQGIVDWFKNSAVGKFFGLGGDDDEEKIKQTGGDASVAEEVYAKDNEKGMFDFLTKENPVSKKAGEVKEKVGNFFSGFFKKDEVPSSTSQLSDDEKALFGGYDIKPTTLTQENKIPFLQGPNKVEGNKVDGSDKSTAKSLEEINAEAAALRDSNKPAVNIQNNNSITNSNQAGNTNTIGFNIHEPDTSFVNVRKDNTQQTI